MINLYKIEGATNKHKEQLEGAYLDKAFWPTFKNDIEKFKQVLIKSTADKTPFSLLRIGHAEYCLLSQYVPKSNVGQGRTITEKKLPRHFSGKQTLNDWICCYESLNDTDYVTTQIGYDFKEWLNDIINFKDRYNEHKNKGQIETLFRNPQLFNQKYKNYKINELMNMPLDIVYGLTANKWLLKTFKNRIGLIGNIKKLNVIKELMKHKEYQRYIQNDYFTDYIGVSQQRAIEDDSLEKTVLDGVESSNCDIFLIGVGVSKLKFYSKLKNVKNCIFLDVGHGIDAIAGLSNYTRPYFGSWVNYGLDNHDYAGIDLCRPSPISIILK